MPAASSNPFQSALDHITKSHGGMPGAIPATKAPPKPPDKTLAKTSGGGGGKPKPKPIADEREDEDAKADREQANTPPPEKPVDRTVVKITNLHWTTDPLVVGAVAWAEMDIAIPPEHANLTAVTCTVEFRVKDGPWKPGTGSFRCDARDGKAACEIALPEPPPGPGGAKPEKVEYRPLAKHAYSKQAIGPEKEAGGDAEDPYDGILYYSPGTDEYLCIDKESDFEDLGKEFSAMARLGRLAKQAREADAEKRKPITVKLREMVKDLFEQTAVVGESDPVVRELILVRKPGKTGKKEIQAHKKTKSDDDTKTWEWSDPPAWAYMRTSSKAQGTGPKGKILKVGDESLKKNLEDLMKKAPGSKEHSPFFSGDLKVNLFNSDPLESKKVAWETSSKKEGKVAGQTFNFSKEAAFSRLVMTWEGAEAGVDLKKKKVKLGVGGNLSYGILEAKMEGDIPLPEKGFNLLSLLKTHPYFYLILEKNRRCLVRFKLGMTGDAFAGLTVSGAVNVLDIDLSKEKLAGGGKRGRHAESGVEGKAFAGAKAEAGLTVGFEWTSPERNKFETLASVAGKAAGTAGIGAEYEWKIEYREGVFFFHGGANLTIALGLQGSFSFELGAAEGYYFIAYIMRCMDFHFVKEISGEAYDAFKYIGFTLMTLGEKAFTAHQFVIDKLVHGAEEILTAGFEEIMRIKRHLWDATSHSSALNNVPPEGLGHALRALMHTREDKDFRSILSILYSTLPRGADIKKDPRANHKLKWTLRSVSPIFISDTESGPETEKKKADALKDGIRKIEDFGNGFGFKNSNGTDAKPNRDFVLEFKRILSENGI